MLNQGPSSPEEFSEWFFEVPILIQVAFILLIIAVLALVFIILFYIFKGIYLLLKGIFQGIFNQSKKVIESKKKIEEPKPQQPPLPTINTQDTLVPQYCSSCGAPVTETMLKQLKERGIAYCALCGEPFEK